MKFLLFLFTLLHSALVIAEQWQINPEMPTARQEIYAATMNDFVYIPGGILLDGLTSAAFEVYDAKNSQWQELAPLPAPRHHVTPAVVNNRLYAIGGFDGAFPNWEMKSDTFIYDIKTNAWSLGTPLPEPQGEHVVAVVGNKIHIIGGRVKGKSGGGHFDAYDDTSAHYIYDVTNDTWTTGKPAPTARNSAAAAVIDGLIYVVGGRQNVVQKDGKQLQQNLGTLEVYDPKTNDWQILRSMPEALGGNAAGVVKGKLYVVGGEQWAPTHKVFASTWAYDPQTDTWQQMPDMPTARHGLAATAVNDTLITIGGCTKVGGGAAVGSTESLSP